MRWAGLLIPVAVYVGCANGQIVEPIPDEDGGGPTDGGVPCTAKCDGGCVDVKTDPSNCGKCGKVCAMGSMCVQGSCQCQMGQSICGTSCVDLKTDIQNCGKCNTLCGNDAGPIMGGGMWACVNSVCQIVCPTSDGGMKTECSGACVDLQTDNDNCGMCGTACAMGMEQCMQGLCCKTGQKLCPGDGGAVCTDTQNDANNCGMCGKICSGNTPACSNGQCIACGNDCWSNAGCITGQGHCIRFACRAGSAGQSFCNQCMGWQEVSYQDWVNNGWCLDVFAKYVQQNSGQPMCGSNNQNCCANKQGCGNGNVYWHFHDGANNRYSGPNMAGTLQNANCTVATGTDNSAYVRLSVCKKN